MANILITGGTGNLGRRLTKILNEKNIPHKIGSRSNHEKLSNWVKLDLLENKGVAEAVNDCDIIVHLATDLKKDSQITSALLNAIKNKAKVHFIYISIVGIDKTPFDYYISKLDSERLIKASGIQYSILRSTQFFEFIDQILSTFLKYPIALLPKRIVAQPIQIEIAAYELYKMVLNAPLNNTIEIGGVQIQSFDQMSKSWLDATNKKRLILNFPIFGKLKEAFYYGSLTTQAVKNESIDWQTWLKMKYK